MDGSGEAGCVVGRVGVGERKQGRCVRGKVDGSREAWWVVGEVRGARGKTG